MSPLRSTSLLALLALGAAVGCTDETVIPLLDPDGIAPPAQDIGPYPDEGPRLRRDGAPVDARPDADAASADGGPDAMFDGATEDASAADAAPDVAPDAAPDTG